MSSGGAKIKSISDQKIGDSHHHMPSNMHSRLWSVLRIQNPCWNAGSGIQRILHPEEETSGSSAQSCKLHWPAGLLNTTLSAIEGNRNLWSRSVSEEIISSYHAEYLGPKSRCTHHSCLHEQFLIPMSPWAQSSLHWRLDWHWQTQAAPSRQCPLQHICSLLSRGIRDDCQSPPHSQVMNSRFFSSHQEDFLQNETVPLTRRFLVLLFWHLIGNCSSFLMVVDWVWLQHPQYDLLWEEQIREHPNMFLTPRYGCPNLFHMKIQWGGLAKTPFGVTTPQWSEGPRVFSVVKTKTEVCQKIQCLDVVLLLQPLNCLRSARDNQKRHGKGTSRRICCFCCCNMSWGQPQNRLQPCDSLQVAPTWDS